MNAPLKPTLDPRGELVTLRQPPHSVEAEQSVLGGLLIDNAAWHRAADLLVAGDFFRHEHQQLWSAIGTLVQANKPADVITVHEQLARLGRADDCGGLAYINSLAQSVPSASHIRRYAEIVAERASLRSIIAVCDATASKAFRQDAPQQILDDAKVLMERLGVERGLASTRVPILGLDELREQSHSLPWLVKRVIPANSIGMLYGASGTFKSFIALDAALHIAHGLPWMGRRTRKAAVLYIAAEGGTGIWPRILAWHEARHLPWTGIGLHVAPVALDLTADAWRLVEAAQAKGVSPALVVVDTLSQTYGGEENSANEVAAYLRELGARFRELWHCAVLLIHHTGHQATERPRGSSAMRNNIDFMFGVFRDEKEMLATLTCAKQKEVKTFDDATFRLSVHELGTDEDGDALTSLVARHLCGAGEVQEAMAAEGRAGRSGRNQMLLQLLQNGMTEKELRAGFYEGMETSDADTRRQAYFRARNWAVRASFIDIAQGRVIVLKSLPQRDIEA